MPELPEVETIRRQLEPLVTGRRVTRLDVRDRRWTGSVGPDSVTATVSGRRIERLSRRGKYLIWELEDEVFLLMHLRMTGTLLVDPVATPAHTRVAITLQPTPAEGCGRLIAFVDPRRFGTGELVCGRGALETFLDARLGLEPLDPAFTAAHLRTLARGRQVPIKAFVLDQRQVAGVGNIYADEALFGARIHPLRPAGRLSAAQYGALAEALEQALRAGIAARGATIDDFRHVDGVRGSFQDQFRVHRRAGLPCPDCATLVVKMVVAGRGTYLCEACQPRPRLRRAPAARPSARTATPAGSPESPPPARRR